MTVFLNWFLLIMGTFVFFTTISCFYFVIKRWFIAKYHLFLKPRIHFSYINFFCFNIIFNIICFFICFDNWKEIADHESIIFFIMIVVVNSLSFLIAFLNLFMYVIIHKALAKNSSDENEFLQINFEFELNKLLKNKNFENINSYIEISKNKQFKDINVYLSLRIDSIQVSDWKELMREVVKFNNTLINSFSSAVTNHYVRVICLYYLDQIQKIALGNNWN